MRGRTTDPCPPRCGGPIREHLERTTDRAKTESRPKAATGWDSLWPRRSGLSRYAEGCYPPSEGKLPRMAQLHECESVCRTGGIGHLTGGRGENAEVHTGRSVGRDDGGRCPRVRRSRLRDRLRRSPRTSPAFLQRASRRARPRPAGCSSVSSRAAVPGQGNLERVCRRTGHLAGVDFVRRRHGRSRWSEKASTRATSSSGSPSRVYNYSCRRSWRPACSSTTSSSMSAATTKGSTRCGEVIDW